MEILSKSTMLGDVAKDTFERGKVNKEIEALNKKLIDEKVAFADAILQNYNVNDDTIDMKAKIAYSNITLLNEEMNKLTRRLNQIRHVKICPNCGKEMHESDKFCSACGGILPEEVPEKEQEVKATEVYPDDKGQDDNNTQVSIE